MYVSVKQLASNLNVSTTRVRKLISEGRIKGAFKIGNVWAIPVIDGKPEATKGRRGPELSWKKHRPKAVSKIHVNQQVIRDNNNTGNRQPVITVKTYNSNTYGHEAIIYGCCRVVYEPDNELNCGAKVWIETYSKVDVICKDFFDKAAG